MLGRAATLADVGNVAAFAASDQARSITATSINITSAQSPTSACQLVFLGVRSESYGSRMRTAKLLNRIATGAVTNVSFSDLVVLLDALGFKEVGSRGSHRVFMRPGVIEILTLQVQRGQAKPYQVRQVAALVRRYNLQLEDEP